MFDGIKAWSCTTFIPSSFIIKDTYGILLSFKYSTAFSHAFSIFLISSSFKFHSSLQFSFPCYPCYPATHSQAIVSAQGQQTASEVDCCCHVVFCFTHRIPPFPVDIRSLLLPTIALD